MTNSATWKKILTSLFRTAGCSLSISSLIDFIKTDTETNWKEIILCLTNANPINQNIIIKRNFFFQKNIPLYPPDRNWLINPWSNSNILTFVGGNLGWSHATFLVGPRVTFCVLNSTLREELGFPLNTAFEPSYTKEPTGSLKS